MNSLLLYLLKAASCHACLYLLYLVLFKNFTFHQWNRIFLNAALIVAFIIPLVSFTISIGGNLHWDELPFYDDFNSSEITLHQTFTSSPTSSGFGISVIFGGLYISGVLLMLTRVLRGMYLFRSSIQKGHRRKFNKLDITFLPKDSPFLGFTFFHRIFLSSKVSNKSYRKIIFNHEVYHAQAGHTYDLILHELSSIILWFSPLVWSQKKTIRNLHEYEADERSITHPNQALQYLQIVMKDFRRTRHYLPVNYFSFISLKKRIHMMYQPKTRKHARWAYLMALPLIAIFLLSFNLRHKEQAFGFNMATITKTLEQGSSDIPDQSPLKTYLKISANYGKRMHPILKKEMFHRGIDYAAEIGTPIYAPADGTVLMAGAHKNEKYGITIYLQHNASTETRYSHLSRVNVHKNDFVHKDDIIGYVGNTGLSTAAHLHYEVWVNGTHTDPSKYIRNGGVYK